MIINMKNSKWLEDRERLFKKSEIHDPLLLKIPSLGSWKKPALPDNSLKAAKKSLKDNTATVSALELKIKSRSTKPALNMDRSDERFVSLGSLSNTDHPSSIKIMQSRPMTTQHKFVNKKESLDTADECIDLLSMPSMPLMKTNKTDKEIKQIKKNFAKSKWRVCVYIVTCVAVA